MQSEDYFTNRIDSWFAERSLAIRSNYVPKKSGTAQSTIDNKLAFGVSKVVRSITEHEAERRKKSAAKSRA